MSQALVSKTLTLHRKEIFQCEMYVLIKYLFGLGLKFVPLLSNTFKEKIFR